MSLTHVQESLYKKLIQKNFYKKLVKVFLHQILMQVHASFCTSVWTRAAFCSMQEKRMQESMSEVQASCSNRLV